MAKRNYSGKQISGGRKDKRTRTGCFRSSKQQNASNRRKK